SYWHLDALKEVQALPGLQGNDRLFPGPGFADAFAAAADLARHVDDVHVGDLDLFVGKCRFDGSLDLDLVGRDGDFEDVLAVFTENGALFGDHGADDGVPDGEAHAVGSSSVDSAGAAASAGSALRRRVG